MAALDRIKWVLGMRTDNSQTTAVGITPKHKWNFDKPKSVKARAAIWRCPLCKGVRSSPEHRKCRETYLR
jgi:hypothetical protein